MSDSAGWTRIAELEAEVADLRAQLDLIRSAWPGGVVGSTPSVGEAERSADPALGGSSGSSPDQTLIADLRAQVAHARQPSSSKAQTYPLNDGGWLITWAVPQGVFEVELDADHDATMLWRPAGFKVALADSVKVWAVSGDARQVAPATVERCPKCGHAPHGRTCLNMASDNDCACTNPAPDTTCEQCQGSGYVTESISGPKSGGQVSSRCPNGCPAPTLQNSSGVAPDTAKERP